MVKEIGDEDERKTGGFAQLYQDAGKAVVFVGYFQCGRDSW